MQSRSLCFLRELSHCNATPFLDRYPGEDREERRTDGLRFFPKERRGIGLVTRRKSLGKNNPWNSPGSKLWSMCNVLQLSEVTWPIARSSPGNYGKLAQLFRPAFPTKKASFVRFFAIRSALPHCVATAWSTRSFVGEITRVLPRFYDWFLDSEPASHVNSRVFAKRKHHPE